MAVAVAIPAGSYPPGTYPLPALGIADAITQATVTLDVSQHTDPAIVWSVTMDLSLDGGASWHFLWGASRVGGVVIHNSVALTTATFQSPVLPAGPGRQMRGTLVVTGGTFVMPSAGTLTTT
jgi:hypothetical protein